MRTEKEVCELLYADRKKNGIDSKYYIKTDFRYNNRKCIFEFEYYGKLYSEVEPFLSDEIKSILRVPLGMLWDRESGKYKETYSESFKPFIIEVWERTDNILKLIYKRNNENEDFEEV